MMSLEGKQSHSEVEDHLLKTIIEDDPLKTTRGVAQELGVDQQSFTIWKRLERRYQECERELLSDATENLKLSIEAHEWFGCECFASLIPPHYLAVLLPRYIEQGLSLTRCFNKPNLSGNRLSDVPACVCESRSLESLRLRDNILRSIPLNIFYLRSLTVLDLSNNKIVHLPLSLFELPLEIVLLNGNRLDSIPHEIRQLSSTLAELDLSCNLLRSIPVDIALLKMLRVLNLRRNLLEQFPSELCRLSLHTLDLSCNRLKHLPPHIGKMGSLVEFHMRHNPLQFPPADLIVKIVRHS
ncbi:hypothetical protein RB195_023870 [Necator americanus]|uniref:Leucine Rich repeat-containing domain protein n=1 Tax=Necator americanus TaxID=51031 RepID=A0ABR1EL03_NECAM